MIGAMECIGVWTRGGSRGGNVGLNRSKSRSETMGEHGCIVHITLVGQLFRHDLKVQTIGCVVSGMVQRISYMYKFLTGTTYHSHSTSS